MYRIATMKRKAKNLRPVLQGRGTLRIRLRVKFFQLPRFGSTIRLESLIFFLNVAFRVQRRCFLFWIRRVIYRCSGCDNLHSVRLRYGSEPSSVRFHVVLSVIDRVDVPTKWLEGSKRERNGRSLAYAQWSESDMPTDKQKNDPFDNHSTKNFLILFRVSFRLVSVKFHRIVNQFFRSVILLWSKINLFLLYSPCNSQ